MKCIADPLGRSFFPPEDDPFSVNLAGCAEVLQAAVQRDESIGMLQKFGVSQRMCISSGNPSLSRSGF